MEPNHDRLKRVEGRLDTLTSEVHAIDSRTGRIEDGVKAIQETLTGLVREVGGVAVGDPAHRSVRARLHDLEGDRHAYELASAAALEATTIMKKAAKESRAGSWSAFQKLLVTAAALVAAAVSVYNALGG